jgi:hypothetical protein
VLFGENVSPLSNNALNVLVVMFGGIVGALGGYLGISASQHRGQDDK